MLAKCVPSFEFLGNSFLSHSYFLFAFALRGNYRFRGAGLPIRVGQEMSPKLAERIKITIRANLFKVSRSLGSTNFLKLSTKQTKRRGKKSKVGNFLWIQALEFWQDRSEWCLMIMAGHLVRSGGSNQWQVGWNRNLGRKQEPEGRKHGFQPMRGLELVWRAWHTRQALR